MINKISECSLEGVKLIETDIFEDFRGTYQETYNLKDYNDNGIEIKFVQDDMSISEQGVLRGLHGDRNTWKLVSCLEGKFFLVVVNYDKNSDNYCKHITFTLSGEDRYQVLIPPSYANGHLVLSKKTIFHYKQSTYYEGMQKQFTLRWNDPKLDINWPIKEPILSSRDSDTPFIS